MNNVKYIKRHSGPTQLMKEVVGDENILLSEFDKWKKRRKIISKAFNFDFVKSLNPYIISTHNKVFNEMIDEKR